MIGASDDFLTRAHNQARANCSRSLVSNEASIRVFCIYVQSVSKRLQLLRFEFTLRGARSNSELSCTIKRNLRDHGQPPSSTSSTTCMMTSWQGELTSGVNRYRVPVSSRLFFPLSLSLSLSLSPYLSVEYASINLARNPSGMFTVSVASPDYVRRKMAVGLKARTFNRKS